jgi:hypothetical protein
MSPSDFVCLNAMPGIGCGLPEMFILGLLYFLASLCAPYFLLQGRMRRDPLEATLWIRVSFSISMFIWLLFRAVISIAPFDYSVQSFQIVSIVVGDVLCLIPVSLAILILCEILFSYRDPGNRTVVFFKVMFLIFLVAFLVIAIVITMANLDDPAELVFSMALWRASTNFVILLFVALPAYQLFKTISGADHLEFWKYTSAAQYGVSFLILVIFVRIVYDALIYAETNPVYNYLNSETESAAEPAGGVRAIQFLGCFLFEIFTSVLIMLAVRVLRFVEQRLVMRRASLRVRSHSSVIEWPLTVPDSTS